MKYWLMGLVWMICGWVPAGELTEGSINGRKYLVYQAATMDLEKPSALVLVLHGGGGKASRMSKQIRFQPLADRDGFLLVYPEGLNGHWNDGRKSEVFAAQDAKVDDVGFIRGLVEHLKLTYKIDPGRIFATGASNGGMMSFRLGIEASDLFAAIAPVIANVPEPFGSGFELKKPVSVLIMNGTEDPMVPYGGGEVTVKLFPRLEKLGRKKRRGRGRVVSTDRSVELWLKANELEGPPVKTAVPDVDEDDGVTAERFEWKHEKVRVVLLKLHGGGHGYPGGKQYLPERIIGKVSSDFDASEVIWAFFRMHGK